jgi:hypothetical protein
MRCLNTLAFIITKVNRPDLRAIAEEHCGLITIDQFEDMYRQIMKTEGHPFLLINYQKPYDKRFWLTFNHQIIVEDGNHRDDENAGRVSDGDPEEVSASHSGKTEPVASAEASSRRVKT